MKNRSGGKILVESLQAHGVRKVFCVPGESYLDALDALYDADDIRLVTCRQEGGAAFMAEAYGKLTGHVGVCFVTRGPGACNASIGVHTAMQDSTPFILLVGQVATDQKGREAFQEVEYRDMFKPPFTKWVAEVERTEDLARIMNEAFDIATSGRPGPVVVALPEDMLSGEAATALLEAKPKTEFHVRPHDVAALKEMLTQAQKPVVIVGGGSWSDKAITQFQAFCEKAQVPVAAGFRRQDAFSNAHACYVGALGTTVDAQLVRAVSESDLIIAVGTRLGEILTQGYTIIKPGKPAQKLVHVYPDASELNKVYKADLAIHADVNSFAAALSSTDIDGKRFSDRTKNMRGRYLEWSQVSGRSKFTLDLDGVIEDLAAQLPADAIITTDAGNFSGWAQRYLRYGRPMRLLAPTSGAMGYGVPSAIAAAITYPQRIVVGFMGDGGFMMTGQEIATAMQNGVRPVFLVFNNSMYGTIRMHQEKHYPGRVSATDLQNPDFAALAKSYGAFGVAVARTQDFLPAWKAAVAQDKPAVIELRMDPQQLTTGKTLDQIRNNT